MIRLVALLAALTITTSGCEPSDVIWWAFRNHPEKVREEAVRVAECESHLIEDARSPGGHAGWFQLSRVHDDRALELGFTWDRVATEGVVNAIVAEDLYTEQGWAPWTCKP